jgi:hypothetical protein
MSETLDRILALVIAGQVRVSDHGYEQLLEDDILATDVFAGVAAARVVEDYPNAAHGPSVLVLENDSEGRPLHILWGIPAGHAGPAVVVTGYRPDPARWSEDYMKRKSQ